jgi:hypothetical protein
LVFQPGYLSPYFQLHSFGDFLGWHPHLHVLCTDGCFCGNGMFRVAPRFELKHLEEIFPAKEGIFDRHKVFPALRALAPRAGLGFNVFCGSRIQAGSEEAMENLARYIIRASFSQERMAYIPEESKVIYQSKDGKNEKVFDPLEWIAAMCSHVPNKGESRRWRECVTMASTVPRFAGWRGASAKRTSRTS